MRRTVSFLALLLLVALAVPAGPTLAQPAGSAAAAGVSGAFNAGAVSALYGAAGGLSTAGGQLFTQNSPGIPGGAKDFDSFGGNFLSAG